MGIGSFGDKGLPELVGEAAWSFVEARSFRTYAIADDGTLWGWGSVINEEGVLEVRPTPGPLGDDDDWSLICAAEGHQCGLKSDGTLLCWGVDTRGALGLGEDTYAATSPTQVGDAAWFDLAVGGTFGTTRSCGIQDGGTLWCWGEGPVGDATRDDQGRPVQIGDHNDWTQVSVGEAICGLRNPGTVWCWGADSTVLEPVQVGEDDDWTAVDAGISRNCGIREPGTLWCWEEDDPPAQVGSGDDWWAVEELLYVTCGLRGEGSLWCWGSDLEGLATGTGGAVPQPTQIGEASDWAAVSVGGLHVCGLRQDGRLYCWGEGSFGRLGHGDAWSDDPVRVR
jgi:alpha-tubulin suppressor-like RCC1 family protein